MDEQRDVVEARPAQALVREAPEAIIALLRDQTGLLIGISAVMREVSKRRVADKELWVRLT